MWLPDPPRKKPRLGKQEDATAVRREHGSLSMLARRAIACRSRVFSANRAREPTRHDSDVRKPGPIGRMRIERPLAARFVRTPVADANGRPAAINGETARNLKQVGHAMHHGRLAARVLENSDLSSTQIRHGICQLANPKAARSDLSVQPAASHHPNSKEKTDVLCHHQRRRRDFLQGLGSEGRAADRVPSRLAAERRRLGHPDAVLPRQGLSRRRP